MGGWQTGGYQSDWRLKKKNRSNQRIQKERKKNQSINQGGGQAGNLGGQFGTRPMADSGAKAWDKKLILKI